jgi:hypothetical protein
VDRDEAWPPDPAVRSATGDDGPAGTLEDRPRIRPSSELFDAAPGAAPGLEPVASPAVHRQPRQATPPPTAPVPEVASSGPSSEVSAGERGLVGDPVSRRARSGAERRSLFGNPLGPVAGPAADAPGPVGSTSDEAPSDEAPSAGESSAGESSAGESSGGAPSTAAAGVAAPAGTSGALEVLEVRADGTVGLSAGIVRLAPGLRPEVSRLGGTVGLALHAGWCWVAATDDADPVLVTLPTASLLVPAGGHALTVVEGDGSVFVSVVRGTVTIDRPGGLLPLPVGTISQLRPDGTVHTDRASPEEMATDEILTRNLVLDEVPVGDRPD